MRNRHPRHIRQIAACTALVFLSACVGTPLRPAYAEAENLVSKKPPIDLTQFAIPSEWGTIDERFQPLSGVSTSAVIYLQDAHAVLDAQKSIQGLLDFLQRQYSLPLVAVEGAAGELKPHLFRSFPSEASRRSVFEKLLQRGEVSGVDTAAVLNAGWSDFVGIEARELYERNRHAFINAHTQKEKLILQIDRSLTKIRGKKTRIYSKALLELDRRLDAFEADPGTLSEFLGWIVSDELSPRDYPHLHLVAGELARERALEDHQKAKEDVELVQLVGRVKSRLAKEEQPEFKRRHSDFLKRKRREEFVQYLFERARELEIPIESYESLSRREARRARLRALAGEEFFGELHRLIETRKASLFRSEEERQIDRDYQQLKLFRKLASLEITREELKTVLNLPPAARPHRALSVSPTDADGQAFLSLWKDLESARRFYELALERDQVLFENLLRVMKEKKIPFAAVVTGGFHVGGIKELLRREGISYVVISPRIREMGESPYLEVMLGKNLSYEKYLKENRPGEFSQIAIPGRLSPELIGEDHWRAFRRQTVKGLVEATVKDSGLPLPLLFQTWADYATKQALQRGLNWKTLGEEVKWAFREYTGGHPDSIQGLYRRVFRKIRGIFGDFFKLRNRSLKQPAPAVFPELVRPEDRPLRRQRAEVRSRTGMSIDDYLSDENLTEGGPWRDLASPVIFRFQNSFVGRGIDTDDLYQEAFQAIFEFKRRREIRGTDPIENPEAYLRQLIGRRFIRLLKLGRNARMIQEGDEEGGGNFLGLLASGAEEGRERVDWADEIAKLMRLSEGLPEDLRRIFLAVMAELHKGETNLKQIYRNVSDKTQDYSKLTPGAVKMRFWRARRILLKRYGSESLGNMGIPISDQRQSRAEVRGGEREDIETFREILNALEKEGVSLPADRKEEIEQMMLEIISLSSETYTATDILKILEIITSPLFMDDFVQYLESAAETPALAGLFDKVPFPAPSRQKVMSPVRLEGFLNAVRGNLWELVAPLALNELEHIVRSRTPYDLLKFGAPDDHSDLNNDFILRWGNEVFLVEAKDIRPDSALMDDEEKIQHFVEKILAYTQVERYYRALKAYEKEKQITIAGESVSPPAQLLYAINASNLIPSAAKDDYKRELKERTRTAFFKRISALLKISSEEAQKFFDIVFPSPPPILNPHLLNPSLDKDALEQEELDRQPRPRRKSLVEDEEFHTALRHLYRAYHAAQPRRGTRIAGSASPFRPMPTAPPVSRKSPAERWAEHIRYYTEKIVKAYPSGKVSTGGKEYTPEDVEKTVRQWMDQPAFKKGGGENAVPQTSSIIQGVWQYLDSSRARALSLEDKDWQVIWREMVKETETGHLGGEAALVQELKKQGFKQEDLNSLPGQILGKDTSLLTLSYGLSEWPQDKLQGKLLEADFENLIRKKIERNDRTLILAFFGVGSVPAEIFEIVRMFYKVLKEKFKEQGEEPSKWKVEVFAFDATPDIVTSTRKLYFDSYNVGKRLDMLGLEAGEFDPDKLHFGITQVNFYDAVGLRNAVKQLMGEKKADYAFQRNVTYSNTFISHPSFFLTPSTHDPGRMRTLVQSYVATRNILLAVGKPGARYVLEPGLGLGEEGGQALPVFGFAGLELINAQSLFPGWKGRTDHPLAAEEVGSRSTGLYLIRDPYAFFSSEWRRTALADFLKEVAKTASSSRAEVRMDLQSIKTSAETLIGNRPAGAALLRELNQMYRQSLAGQTVKEDAILVMEAPLSHFELRKAGTRIGIASINFVIRNGKPAAEVGREIFPTYQRQGYGTAFIETVLRTLPEGTVLVQTVTNTDTLASLTRALSTSAKGRDIAKAVEKELQEWKSRNPNEPESSQLYRLKWMGELVKAYRAHPALIPSPDSEVLTSTPLGAHARSGKYDIRVVIDEKVDLLEFHTTSRAGGRVIPKEKLTNGLPVVASEGTSAQRLVEAFQLAEAQEAAYQGKVGELEVYRIRIPGAPAGGEPPEGLELLRAHLAPTDQFELLYNDQRQLIAVFPVWSDQLAEASYFDLTAYYPAWPRIGEKNPMVQWERYLEERGKNRKAIDEYVVAKGIPENRIFQKWDLRQDPFILAEVDPESPTGLIRVTTFDPAVPVEPLGELLELKHDPKKVQVLFMNYPTVYNPGLAPHAAADSDFLMRAFQAAREKLQPGDVDWDDATGTGILAFIKYAATKGRLGIVRLASDYNALAVANARHLADEAGFELQTAVSDTRKGRFPFQEAAVKLATSNSPAFQPITAPDSSADRLPEEFAPVPWWDNDIGGAYVEGLALIYSRVLNPEGLGLAWYVIPADDGLDKRQPSVRETLTRIFQEAGLVVRHEGFDQPTPPLVDHYGTFYLTPVSRRAEVRAGLQDKLETLLESTSRTVHERQYEKAREPFGLFMSSLEERHFSDPLIRELIFKAVPLASGVGRLDWAGILLRGIRREAVKVREINPALLARVRELSARHTVLVKLTRRIRIDYPGFKLEGRVGGGALTEIYLFVGPRGEKRVLRLVGGDFDFSDPDLFKVTVGNFQNDIAVYRKGKLMGHFPEIYGVFPSTGKSARELKIQKVRGVDFGRNIVGAWVEYIDGPTAPQARLKGMSEREILEQFSGIVRDLAAGGLDLWDVKPDNFLIATTLESGRQIEMVDLGAAKPLSRPLTLERIGQLVEERSKSFQEALRWDTKSLRAQARTSARSELRVTEGEVLDLASRDDRAWIVFADMMRLNLRDAAYGRQAADFFIEEVVRIAGRVMARHGGRAYRIGDRADEVGMILPSRLEPRHVEDILGKLQKEIEKEFQNYGYAQLTQNLSARDLALLRRQGGVISTQKLPSLAAGNSLRRTRSAPAILFKKGPNEKPETALRRIFTKAGLAWPQAEVVPVEIPYLPAGAVRMARTGGEPIDRLRQSLKKAELFQGIAKERGLLFGVEGNEMRIRKREGGELFSSPAKSRIESELKEWRGKYKDSPYAREEEYGVFQRQELIRILKDVLANPPEEFTTYVIRGPPDNFFVVFSQNGKWQVALIQPVIVAATTAQGERLQEAFDEILRRAGRQAREAGKYGFKVINDYEEFGHLFGNQLIKLESVELARSLKRTGKRLLHSQNPALTLGRTLERVVNNVSQRTRSKGFTAEFDVTLIASDDLPSRLSPARILRHLDRMSRARSATIVISNERQFPHVRIKSFKENKTRSQQQKISRELLAARRQVRKRAFEELRSAQARVESSRRAEVRSETESAKEEIIHKGEVLWQKIKHRDPLLEPKKKVDAWGAVAFGARITLDGVTLAAPFNNLISGNVDLSEIFTKPWYALPEAGREELKTYRPIPYYDFSEEEIQSLIAYLLSRPDRYLARVDWPEQLGLFGSPGPEYWRAFYRGRSSEDSLIGRQTLQHPFIAEKIVRAVEFLAKSKQQTRFNILHDGAGDAVLLLTVREELKKKFPGFEFHFYGADLMLEEILKESGKEIKEEDVILKTGNSADAELLGLEKPNDFFDIVFDFGLLNEPVTGGQTAAKILEKWAAQLKPDGIAVSVQTGQSWWHELDPVQKPAALRPVAYSVPENLFLNREPKSFIVLQKQGAFPVRAEDLFGAELPVPRTEVRSESEGESQEVTKVSLDLLKQRGFSDEEAHIILDEVRESLQRLGKASREADEIKNFYPYEKNPFLKFVIYPVMLLINLVFLYWAGTTIRGWPSLEEWIALAVWLITDFIFYDREMHTMGTTGFRGTIYVASIGSARLGKDSEYSTSQFRSTVSHELTHHFLPPRLVSAFEGLRDLERGKAAMQPSFEGSSYFKPFYLEKYLATGTFDRNEIKSIEQTLITDAKVFSYTSFFGPLLFLIEHTLGYWMTEKSWTYKYGEELARLLVTFFYGDFSKAYRVISIMAEGHSLYESLRTVSEIGGSDKLSRRAEVREGGDGRIKNGRGNRRGLSFQRWVSTAVNRLPSSRISFFNSTLVSPKSLPSLETASSTRETLSLVTPAVSASMSNLRELPWTSISRLSSLLSSPPWPSATTLISWRRDSSRVPTSVTVYPVLLLSLGSFSLFIAHPLLWEMFVKTEGASIDVIRRFVNIKNRIKNTDEFIYTARAEARSLKEWLTRMALLSAFGVLTAGEIMPAAAQPNAPVEKAPAQKAKAAASKAIEELKKAFSYIQFEGFEDFYKKEPELAGRFAEQTKKGLDYIEKINPRFLADPPFKSKEGFPRLDLLSDLKQEIVFEYRVRVKGRPVSHSDGIGYPKIKNDPDLWKQVVATLVNYYQLRPEEQILWWRLLDIEFDRRFRESQERVGQAVKKGKFGKLEHGLELAIEMGGHLKAEYTFEDYLKDYLNIKWVRNPNRRLQKFIHLLMTQGEVRESDFEPSDFAATQREYLYWIALAVGGVIVLGGTVWLVVRIYKRKKQRASSSKLQPPALPPFPSGGEPPISRAEVRAEIDPAQLGAVRAQFEYALDEKGLQDVRPGRLPREGRGREYAFDLRLLGEAAVQEGSPLRKRLEDLQQRLRLHVADDRKLYLPPLEALHVAIAGRYPEKLNFLTDELVRNGFNAVQAQVSAPDSALSPFDIHVAGARITDNRTVVLELKENEALARLRITVNRTLEEAGWDSVRGSLQGGGVITLARMIPDPKEDKLLLEPSEFQAIEEIVSKINQELSQEPLVIRVEGLSFVTPSREFLSEGWAGEQRIPFTPAPRAEVRAGERIIEGDGLVLKGSQREQLRRYPEGLLPDPSVSRPSANVLPSAGRGTTPQRIGPAGLFPRPSSPEPVTLQKTLTPTPQPRQILARPLGIGPGILDGDLKKGRASSVTSFIPQLSKWIHNSQGLFSKESYHQKSLSTSNSRAEVRSEVDKYNTARPSSPQPGGSYSLSLSREDKRKLPQLSYSVNEAGRSAFGRRQSTVAALPGFEPGSASSRGRRFIQLSYRAAEMQGIRGVIDNQLKIAKSKIYHAEVRKKKADSVERIADKGEGQEAQKLQKLDAKRYPLSAQSRAKAWEREAAGLLLARSREEVRGEVKEIIAGQQVPASEQEVEDLTTQVHEALAPIRALSKQTPLAEAGVQWKEELMRQDPRVVEEAAGRALQPIYDLINPLVSHKPKRIILRIESAGEDQRFLENLLPRMVSLKDKIYVMTQRQNPKHTVLKRAAEQMIADHQRRTGRNPVTFSPSSITEPDKPDKLEDSSETKDIRRLYDGGKARGMAAVVVTKETLHKAFNQVWHDPDEIPEVLRADINDLMAFLTSELPGALEDLQAKEGPEAAAGLLLQLKERGVVVKTEKGVFTASLDPQIVQQLLAEIRGIQAAQTAA